MLASLTLGTVGFIMWNGPPKFSAKSLLNVRTFHYFNEFFALLTVAHCHFYTLTPLACKHFSNVLFHCLVSLRCMVLMKFTL